MNKRADRHGADATVPAVNGYTRFYSSGSLEICFLGLEEFDASADLQTLRGAWRRRRRQLLPLCLLLVAAGVHTLRCAQAD